ncbi:hypothetical protein [Kitasatospora paranensis]|uniref:Cellulase n=1 Tax=Kitasatospora paranensis TaxID=258053 RepID=A0ABW2G9R1_9ACTN
MAPDDHPEAAPGGFEAWVRAELADAEAAALRGHRRARLRGRSMIVLAVVSGIALAVALVLAPRPSTLRPVPGPAPTALSGTPSGAACCPPDLPGGCPRCWPAGR